MHEPIIAVLDANILWSTPARSFLLELARYRMFHPLWSKKIYQEWTKSFYYQYRPKYRQEHIRHVGNLMNAAFPEAIVRNYGPLIKHLVLPDPKDRHVLAAGIVGKATHIVTFNLKDFPERSLRKYDMVAIHPDKFLQLLYQRDPLTMLRAFRRTVARMQLHRPDARHVLVDALRRSRLPFCRRLDQKELGEEHPSDR